MSDFIMHRQIVLKWKSDIPVKISKWTNINIVSIYVSIVSQSVYLVEIQFDDDSHCLQI